MTSVAAPMAARPEAGAGKARPYGLIGLPISIFIILTGALLICVLGAVLAFVLAALVLGKNQALDGLRALQASVADPIQLARANVAVSIITYAAISAAVLAAARFRGGRQWRDLVAWHAWHPFRGTRVFWLVAAATVAYSLAADAIISNYYPPSRDWVTLPKGPVWVGLFVVLAVVMAPLTEELLFRGWLYTGLRERLAPGAAGQSVARKAASVFDDRAADPAHDPDRGAANLRSIGVWVSIVVTAALFALAHWEKSHLYALAVFPVGLALGYFRERAGSLMASMTFHAVYNGAALATLALGF